MNLKNKTIIIIILLYILYYYMNLKNKTIIIIILSIFLICISIWFIYNYIIITDYDLYKNKNEEKYDSILKWFNNFANKNNINYSLAYGTMLGYVRNKNYIPYDTDMDLFIGKEDAYKIIQLINNDNIMYNSDIDKNGELSTNKIYIIITKDHDKKFKNRSRYNCKGEIVDSQIDPCSQNELFARVIYNNTIWCDLFVYSENKKEDEYNVNCGNHNCVYIATHTGSNLPETKNIKLNNINTKIFKSDKFIHNLLIQKYKENYLKPDHKYKNGKWIKI